MRCSTDGCEQDAVVQWQRPATDEERDTELDSIRDRLSTVNEHRRLGMRAAIAELRDVKDRPRPAHLSADDERQIKASIDARIGQVQAEHDQITDQIDLTHHLPMSVAVFGCDTHTEAAP